MSPLCSGIASHILYQRFHFEGPATEGMPPSVNSSSTRPSLADLQARAKSVRRHIITSTTAAASGHPTSSLSAVEVAVALYFGGILRHDPKNPHWPQRVASF